MADILLLLRSKRIVEEYGGDGCDHYWWTRTCGSSVDSSCLSFCCLVTSVTWISRPPDIQSSENINDFISFNWKNKELSSYTLPHDKNRITYCLTLATALQGQTQVATQTSWPHFYVSENCRKQKLNENVENKVRKTIQHQHDCVCVFFFMRVCALSQTHTQCPNITRNNLMLVCLIYSSSTSINYFLNYYILTINCPLGTRQTQMFPNQNITFRSTRYMPHISSWKSHMAIPLAATVTPFNTPRRSLTSVSASASVAEGLQY